MMPLKRKHENSPEPYDNHPQQKVQKKYQNIWDNMHNLIETTCAAEYSLVAARDH